MFISCPECRTRFRLDDKKLSDAGIRLKCSRCSALFALSSDKKSRGSRLVVLVAHEGIEFCAAVEKVLAPEPFDIISCHDGREALDLALKLRPDVVLLNVALPTLYGFQICEALRADPDVADIRIILLAAIYDKTKYKRSPQSLYGADDYIEQHHIPDSLVRMIYRLVADDAGQEADKLHLEPVLNSDCSGADADEFKKELIPAPLSSGAVVDEEAVRAARQLARSIVSDISLYREAELEEGVRNDTFEQCLGIEIRDGRAIFDSRMPDAKALGIDFYAEALDHLVRQKRREMGIFN